MQQILKAEVLGANAGGRAGGVEDGSMGGKGDRALIFAMQTKAQRLHHMGRWCVEGQSRRGRVDKGFIFAIQARARGFHHRVHGALLWGSTGGCGGVEETAHSHLRFKRKGRIFHHRGRGFRSDWPGFTLVAALVSRKNYEQIVLEKISHTLCHTPDEIISEQRSRIVACNLYFCSAINNRQSPQARCQSQTKVNRLSDRQIYLARTIDDRL